MALPVAPDPISLGDLQTNFGGTSPASLNEYYRGGTFVANIPENNNVPTSGRISLEDFYGAVTKITVVNNADIRNVSMQTAFTIGGINYWTRNVEKEYINNGTIGSNDATLPALTVSNGRSGTFTLTNSSTGSILGAGGDGARVQGIATNARSDGQTGGTAIQNNSSNYTIVNSGVIYGGGGGGARGRNGGDGGQGGYGNRITGTRTITTSVTEQKCGSCYNGSGGFGTNVVVFANGRNIYERFNAPAGATLRSIRPGNFICSRDRRSCSRPFGRLLCIGFIYETYCATGRYDVRTTVPTYTRVNGCAGAAGNTTGGRGGQGQGYQRTSGPESGQTGLAPQGSNCCPDSGLLPVGRLAGCGGARGRGGNGSSGGTWGQSGGTQETSSALSGSTGLSGFDVERNVSTPGQPGRSPGNNPSSPGAGGFYLAGSSGRTVTFSGTGSVLGRLS